MLDILLLVVLLVLSVVDIIWKKFPSGFLTGILFLVAVTSFIFNGTTPIVFGLFSFIIGWMFLEFSVPIRGVADLKIITMIGMLVTDLRFLFTMISLIMLYGFIFQMVMLKFYKFESESELPFVPILTLCYISLYILGGII